MIISKRILAEITDHAGRSPAQEVCGILAGKNGRAEKVYKMTNASDNPKICYFMDPKEQFEVLKEIRSLGLELIAIYHSHTDSEAYPSARDVELGYYPDAVYIIISVPVVKAYKIIEGKIISEEIKHER